MPYCSKCGYKVRDDEPFCEICGTRIRANTEGVRRNVNIGRTERTAKIYEGNMHTCRHCGAQINSFTSVCPDCGAEIRDTETSRSLEKFYNDYQRARDDKAKIALIKTFPVPNSKEDIYEFMFLAASNFNAKMYIESKEEETVNNAWYSKLDQCYHKAVRSLKTSEMDGINSLYSEVQAKIKSAEESRNGLIALGILLIVGGVFAVRSDIEYLKISGTIMVIAGIIILIMKLSSSKDEESSDKKMVMPINQGQPQQKEGFSSWSGGKKAGWVVLNLYTLGIPALLRSKKKK